MLEFRRAQEADKPAIWRIIRAVIAGGDTYVFSPDTSESEMLAYWFSPEKYNYVALLGENVVGTLWLRANQRGLGSHVANAAYMFSPDAKGQGVGKQMALFPLEEAKLLGFIAMQFNFGVKSNTVAVNLWKNIGFEVIGEIPDAFNHSANGLTNAYIMYRKL